jgi:two-component system response regulator HydG
MFEQELNNYWKTVVDTIQDGVMIVDIKGTIVSVNKGLVRITGYTEEELIGKPCSMLNCNICEIARGNKGGHWCNLFRDGALSMRRCALVKNDGSYTHVLKNASLLHDTRGQILGAVETMTDITEIIEKDIQIEAFRRELKAEDGFQGILGISAPMQRVFDMVTNAAQSDAPVIIFGESGTGKELISKAIHDIGKRKQQPFIKVNCAALTESLLESELFGHVKGAFTGAYQNREGRFEAARDGDIFLDEIGDLPLATQVKLLRVIEDKIIERVGDNKPIPIDARIISATHKDLLQLIEQGAFREDLFYRINVIPIAIPPLRERVEDIPIIADSFFRRLQLKSGKTMEGISNDAMGALLNYSWPGNVRELKSAFEYAFVTCQEKLIQPYHLPPAIFKGKNSPAAAPKTHADQDEIKKKQLVEALERTNGNQSKAAQILGISRVTVWNRIKRFNIQKEFKA